MHICKNDLASALVSRSCRCFMESGVGNDICEVPVAHSGGVTAAAFSLDPCGPLQVIWNIDSVFKPLSYFHLSLKITLRSPFTVHHSPFTVRSPSHRTRAFTPLRSVSPCERNVFDNEHLYTSGKEMHFLLFKAQVPTCTLGHIS